MLCKAEKGSEYWPRITKEKLKTPFLKTDFSRWVDEDEQDGAAAEDLDDIDAMGGMEGMGGMDTARALVSHLCVHMHETSTYVLVSSIRGMCWPPAHARL
jgi:hypothetical protein